jgi:hypothetical protein
MNGDNDGGGKLRFKSFGEKNERVDPPGRSAYREDVSINHRVLHNR